MTTEIAKERLHSFITRIENLESEKKNIADDIRDIYLEAKGTGFDAKTIRKIVKLRKKDSDKRAEEQALLELYAHAVDLEHVVVE